ncbi:MAG TPA: DUF488 domain-containing protein [Longimicrobiales bacterium]|nr:DUF488 domain-containing protein [Longimicrobiales bacterium]
MGKKKVDVRTKRIYDPRTKDEGWRVLVDRLWPRGLKKEDARIDEWARDLAPSTELRKWFGHDPKRWTEFQRRYRAELREQEEALEALRERARKGRVTLLYGAKDEQHNQAVVLAELLREG